MENDEDVKEEMFMALRNMVSLNDEKNIKSSIKTLIDKLELLKYIASGKHKIRQSRVLLLSYK